MTIYLKGIFARHFEPRQHLHFKVTNVILTRKYVRDWNELIGKCFVVQPNRLRRRKYEVVDSETILGRKDVVVGRLQKSRKFPKHWRFIIYAELLP